MFCIRCGKPLEEKSGFCSFYGQNQETLLFGDARIVAGTVATNQSVIPSTEKTLLLLHGWRFFLAFAVFMIFIC